MPKKPVSLTLEEANLLWLKGRARVLAGGSISEAVDQLVGEARAGRIGAAEPVRSVVGTIDLADDPLLTDADAAIRDVFASSLARPVAVPRNRSVLRRTATRAKKPANRTARG